MISLSIIILTHNSEKYLHEVLSSCQFANEVLLIDSGSQDETHSIAQQFSNVQIIQQPWLGFGPQKQRGVEAAKNNWVFVLDSDEVILDSLKDEIISTLEKPLFHGYFIPRINYFFGKAMKRMGLYPDATLRLFNKNHGHFSDDQVHEKVLLSGTSRTLSSPMKHYAYESIEQFIAKQNRYSSLGAKGNHRKALLNPTWTFFKLYLLKGGFLEGWRGYVIAKLYAQYTFWKYIK